MDGNICRHCGYVRITFPSVLPEAISRMEEERVAVMRKRLEAEQEAERRYGAESRKDKEQIGELTRKLGISGKLAARLEAEKQELQQRLEELSAGPRNPLKGVVIIEDVAHDVRAAFPVYEGLNTYGSDPGSGLHHQIKFRVRGYAFLPVHFSVLTTDKGLKIEPAEGVELYRNGGLLQEAAYARQSDNFVSGDNKIRVNISPIV